MAVPRADGRLARLAVRGGLIALAAAAVGLVYVLATVPPGEDTFYPRCQLHSLTGLHCPGCGTTRALHALLNGHPLDSLAYNALCPIVLPLLAWAFVHSIRVSRGLASSEPSRRSRIGFRLLVVIFLAYGILRNLPWYPFTLLAPHELSSP